MSNNYKCLVTLLVRNHKCDMFNRKDKILFSAKFVVDMELSINYPFDIELMVIEGDTCAERLRV